MNEAIVLFAHGARDPEWAEPFRTIRERVSAQRPGVPVELAYLEFMAPSLDDAVASLVAAGATRIGVVPLFMAQGGHLRREVPLMIERLRSRHADAEIVLSPPIGSSPELLDAIAAWAARAA
ncbi:MAG: CbiX/SirB N-terminal domain-containing protein [Burkholderiales bacterium]|nr:CbiX/SirB N-terminal domain-containing protein [Burkholderiales bacterium]